MHPPAHSLLADYFSRNERPRAVSIFMLGGYLSILGGYLYTGWMTQAYGWRATFLSLGIPGAALALLAWFTLVEPRRNRYKLVTMRTIVTHESSEGFGAVFRLLWANPSFRHLLAGFAVLFFFVQGIWHWQPAYFARTYHLGTGALGTWFAFCVGIPGLVGTYAGGTLAMRVAAGNERRQLIGTAGVIAIFGLASTMVYCVADYRIAFIFVAIANATGAMANGPLFATVQSVVPAHMRAMSIAIIYLFANLIGMGLGPLAAGLLSDLLRQFAGRESLGLALLILCPGHLWSAWHLLLAAKTVQRDADAVQLAAEPVA